MSHDDDEWDDLDDEETSEASDDTIECPYCHAAIYDDAVQCPRCGKYLSDEDAPAQRKPWWVLIGLALALYAVYRWIAG